MYTKVSQCIGIAVPEGDEQLPRLMLQLIEIRPDGKVAGGHNEPPCYMPGVRQIGRRRFVGNQLRNAVSGGLGPLRGLEASCTRPEYRA